MGFNFTPKCDRRALLDIRDAVTGAFKGTGFETVAHVSEAERDFYLGARLISPEFDFQSPGTAMLLNAEKSVSILINEEDHVRIQSLTPGFSTHAAESFAMGACDHLEKSVQFAWSPRFGYLCASPFNSGHGRRLSAMFHLIGLAHLKRLPSVIKALLSRQIMTRGLFGESSRAVGAFVQVSVTDARREDFAGACEYLLAEERIARTEVGRDHLTTRANQILEYVQSSPKLSLGDSLRVLGWVRWASVAGLETITVDPREVDAALAAIEVRGAEDDEGSGRQRAEFLRGFLDV